MARIMAGTLVLVAAILAGCGGSAQAPMDWLRLTLSLSDASPRVGQSTTLQLSATNDAHIPMYVTFTSSQRYDFVVRDADAQVVWQWSHGQQFLQILSRELMNPGESWSFTETWSLDDNDGDPLAPGNYTVQGELVCIGAPRAELVTLVIQPAG